MIEHLLDGSHRSKFVDQRDIHHIRSGVRVWAVEYTIAGHDRVYRLVIAILDTAKAGGEVQLAAGKHKRCPMGIDGRFLSWIAPRRWRHVRSLQLGTLTARRHEAVLAVRRRRMGGEPVGLSQPSDG